MEYNQELLEFLKDLVYGDLDNFTIMKRANELLKQLEKEIK
jgi:hypothetical protein